MNSVRCWKAPIAATLVALCHATIAVAGANPYFTLPLHAKASSYELCTGYLPVDCRNVHPTVNVPSGPTVIFLFVMNYGRVAGVQTAFAPDPNWIFLFGLWDCQPGPLPIVVPTPPFGPGPGTIHLTFDCLDTGALAVLGRMSFYAANGCLFQTHSNYPLGTHAIDCAGGVDQIHPGEEYRLGRICVGQGGYAPCSVMPAVEAASWGRIKAQYE